MIEMANHIIDCYVSGVSKIIVVLPKCFHLFEHTKEASENFGVDPKFNKVIPLTIENAKRLGKFLDVEASYLLEDTGSSVKYFQLSKIIN